MPHDDSPLVKYARHELELAGLFDASSDYGGLFGKAVMDLMKVYADQGHSGVSGEMVVNLFSRLARFQPISPLTYEPDQWVQHQPDFWQHRRDSAVFSRDQGKTNYRVD